MSQIELTAEDIAYWYLRLNGFLTLDNFLVHGDRRGHTRTDIDVLGIRFRFRREHLKNPMSDDTWVEEAKRSIVVFCEAKKGPQDLNPSWASPERKVMESFLALVGAVSPKLQPAVAKDLYAAGRSELADGFLITTLLINHDPCGRVIRRWPNAPRVTLSDALDFVYGRFRSYEMIKTDHSQWRPSGHRLWDRFEQHRYSRDDFVERLLQEIGVV